VFTGCDKDEDEGKIDVAGLSGVWEVTHQAIAWEDGFSSIETASKALAAFDWEQTKEAIDQIDYRGYFSFDFLDFRTDNTVAVYYYPGPTYTTDYKVKEIATYKIDGRDIHIEEEDYRNWLTGYGYVPYTIVSLSGDNLVLETWSPEEDSKISDYNATYGSAPYREEEGGERAFGFYAIRFFFTKRTAVPNEDDYVSPRF
jgi:hypothetical protein